MNDKSDITKTRVLIVDDNLLNRKLACAILRNHNIEHDTAENGKTALNYFLTGKFNVVLMDIQMPVMNGIECAVKIREHEKTNNITSPIPIIAVTAFASDDDRHNCIDAGMNDFIPKPYKTVSLMSVISKYIEVKNTV